MRASSARTAAMKNTRGGQDGRGPPLLTNKRAKVFFIASVRGVSMLRKGAVSPHGNSHSRKNSLLRSILGRTVAPVSLVSLTKGILSWVGHSWTIASQLTEDSISGMRDRYCLNGK